MSILLLSLPLSCPLKSMRGKQLLGEPQAVKRDSIFSLSSSPFLSNTSLFSLPLFLRSLDRTHSQVLEAVSLFLLCFFRFTALTSESWITWTIRYILKETAFFNHYIPGVFSQTRGVCMFACLFLCWPSRLARKEWTGKYYLPHAPPLTFPCP